MLIAAVLLSGSAVTAASQCAAQATLVEECREIHGRLQATNGSPGVRIWVIGTRRVLGVAGREGRELLPSSLRVRVNSETVIYGDYRVCPVTREHPRAMQMVCVDAGRRLIQEKIETGHVRPLPDATWE